MRFSARSNGKSRSPLPLTYGPCGMSVGVGEITSTSEEKVERMIKDTGEGVGDQLFISTGHM